MLACAVVGLGWWGQRIVNDLQQSDVVKVVAAVDPLGTNRDAVAPLLPHLNESLDDAIAAGGIDGVILTSPHRFHSEQMLLAAAAGLHVFCEKPFSVDVAEAERAISALQDAGLVVGIGHERRFEPAVAALRAAVAAGELGTPLVLEGTFSHDKFLALPGDNWRLSPRLAPVGPLSATGIHLMDLSIALLGRPSSVWAHLNSDVPPLANGAALSFGMAFEEGGSAVVTAVLTTPFAMRLCLYGSHGWVEIRDRTHPESPTGWDVTTRRRGDSEPTTEFWPAHPAVRSNLEAWGRAALGGAPYPVRIDEILDNVRAFQAITEAALNGACVRILR